MAVEITVKVYHRHTKGDTSFHIESHTIDGSKLNWWKSRSGNGDFVLLSAHPMNNLWVSLL